MKSNDSQLIGIFREQTLRLQTFSEQVPVESLPRYLEITAQRLSRLTRFGGRSVAAEPAAVLAKLFSQCSAELSHGQLLTVVRYLQMCGSIDQPDLVQSIDRLVACVPDMNMYQLISFIQLAESSDKFNRSHWSAVQSACSRLAQFDFTNISTTSALEVLGIFAKNANHCKGKREAVKSLTNTALAGNLSTWSKVSLLKCMRDLSQFNPIDPEKMSSVAADATSELVSAKLQPRALADLVTVCTAMSLDPPQLECAVDLVARNLGNLDLKQMLELLWEQLAAENNHSQLIYALVNKIVSPERESLVMYVASRSILTMKKLVEINAALQIDQRLSELPQFSNDTAFSQFEEKCGTRVGMNKSFLELKLAVDALVDPHFFPQGLKAAPATFYGMHIPLYSKRHRLVIDFDSSYDAPNYKLRRLLFKHLKLRMLVVTERNWKKLSEEGKQEQWLREQIMATVRGSMFLKKI